MESLRKKSQHLVMGIMSGTSLDGVDYALCKISKNGPKLLKTKSLEFPAVLKKRLLSVAENKSLCFEAAQLHHDLGRFYAAAAPQWRVDYAALHGQTVYHNPNKKNPATLQIGEPSYLAQKIKAPVICQFRTMDMAVGGQGAPLATAFHSVAFSQKNTNVAVNNIGGISNVTFLPKNGDVLKIRAFDTGPGNMLIDRAVQWITKGREQFDQNGRLARFGVGHLGLVQKWISQNDYYSQQPPKSTGRELYNEAYFNKLKKEALAKKLNPYDFVATLTLYTAETIAQSYLRFFKNDFPSRVVICGGGAQNQTLIKMLQYQLNSLSLKQSAEVVTSQDLGWPSQSVEPAAFAWMAYLNLMHKAGNIPSATGANQGVRLGQIVGI